MDALDLAGYVVKYGLDNFTPVTNLQLQKILYFLQIRSLQEKPDAPIIDNPNFEAWKFGPVIRKVYDKFCLSGEMPIIIYPREINTEAVVDLYINHSLDLLCKKNPWDLVSFSHRQEGAWYKSYLEGSKVKIKDYDIFTEAIELRKDFIDNI